MDDKHKALLAKHFDAKIEPSRKWTQSYVDHDAPFSYDALQHTMEFLQPMTVNRQPWVEISVPPHAAAMLCDMLDMLINHPNNLHGGSMTGPMFQYAENVMRRQAMELAIREGNPTVKSLYEQYQTALRLCA